MSVGERGSCSLADFTGAALILPRLSGRNTREVIQELAQVLQLEREHTDYLFPTIAALTRELLTSTSLDSGAALPQVRLPSVQSARFALGRSAQPLLWRAPAFPPIDFVFLVIRPTANDREADQLVSALAKFTKNRERLDPLRQARNVDEILAVFKQIPVTACAGTSMG